MSVTSTPARAAVSHLDVILSAVQAELGPLQDKTLAGVVGFDAGGPVSIIESRAGDYYVTTELHDLVDQLPSYEGRQYEVALVTSKGAKFAQTALTVHAWTQEWKMIRNGQRIEMYHDDLSPDDLCGDVRMIPSERGDCGCYVIVEDGQTYPGARQ